MAFTRKVLQDGLSLPQLHCIVRNPATGFSKPPDQSGGLHLFGSYDLLKLHPLRIHYRREEGMRP